MSETKKKKLSELNRLNKEDFLHLEKTPLVIVLDNVRSALNVGSAFRTADSFALKHIYLCGITACPPHKEITKTAIGAEDTVAWTYHKNTTDAIDELKRKGYTILSIEQAFNSVELQSYSHADESPIAIVMGNEVKGVQQEVIDLSDYCIEIPQFGTKHSLNVSVCTGIVCWEILSKTLKRI